MLITREIDYAVRIVRILSQGGKKTIGDICQEELIPRQFSYKILKKLEKGGLVKIFQGAGGGYALIVDTKDTTLFDIVTSINPELVLNDCLSHGYNCPLNEKGGKLCGVHVELDRIQTLIFGHFKEKPLSEIFS